MPPHRETAKVSKQRHIDNIVSSSQLIFYSLTLKSQRPIKVRSPFTMRSEKPRSKPRKAFPSEFRRIQSRGAATAMYGVALSFILYFVKIPKKK